MARQPDAYVLAKLSTSSGDDRLVRVGAAWKGKAGYTITIEAVPLAWLHSTEPLVLQLVDNQQGGRS